MGLYLVIVMSLWICLEDNFMYKEVRLNIEENMYK